MNESSPYGEDFLPMIGVELFELCKDNNRYAQRMLYDAFKPKLMGLCRRYTRSREDAKDVLQDSFIKIFSNLSTVTDVAKLESWMKTITVHTAIDHYYKFKRSELTQYITPDFDLPNEEGDTCISQLHDELLISIIADLPEGCRLVFNLFEIEGYSHTEIGLLLNISEGTARSQLHYAKYLLKKRLSKLGIKRYEKSA